MKLFSINLILILLLNIQISIEDLPVHCLKRNVSRFMLLDEYLEYFIIINLFIL